MRAVNRARGEVDGRGGEGGVAEALGRARDAAGERDGRRGVALAARPGHVDRRHRKAERRGARRCESLQPRNLDAGGRGGLVGKGGGEVLCPRGALVEGDRELVRRHRQHQPAGLRRHPPHLDGLLVSRANGKQTRRRGGAVGVGEVLRDPVVCGDAAVAEVAVPLARLHPTALRRGRLCGRVEDDAADRVGEPDHLAGLELETEEEVDAELVEQEGLGLRVGPLTRERKVRPRLQHAAARAQQQPVIAGDRVGMLRVGVGHRKHALIVVGRDAPEGAVIEDVQAREALRPAVLARLRLLDVVRLLVDPRLLEAPRPHAVDEGERRRSATAS
mmetsp:Transcript_42335/g.132793  ORF Transcript_42335/g.132793 Transcript_42335/m.132793 type:complete len:332 (+) Transcript_42335:202-1197(+)